MSARRGVTLVMAMFLALILLVMGMSLLGSRSTQYRGAANALYAAQALAMAQAGLEDARVKLDHDLVFPPPAGDTQPRFGYVEELTDVGSARVCGSYQVTVDRTYAALAPYSVIRITSVGCVGPRDRPLATRVLHAELDVALADHLNPANPNPNLFQYINYVDEGSL